MKIPHKRYRTPYIEDWHAGKYHQYPQWPNWLIIRIRAFVKGFWLGYKK